MKGKKPKKKLAATRRQMKENLFQRLTPHVKGNTKLRPPQCQAFLKIAEHFHSNLAEREISIILPVGCGKSGLITIAPFAAKAKRALVIAPGVNIASQLYEDFDPTKPYMFYRKCSILSGTSYPEPAEIRGRTMNLTDLENADVVITNIQQLQGEENRWLNNLPHDFFDLILFDEAHHNVAASWETLRSHFPEARIVNFSATPTRADGQLMSGKVIYSYPVCEAIEEGYVKRLKAVVLNPSTLRYVRREDGKEIEVSLDEVRELGEQDAGFRRSIVSSKESLNTIVDCSLQELYKLREATQDNRHKIITSALNYEHCIQIVQAYREKGVRAEYIHSRETGPNNHNQRVLSKLDNHDLDVIVQVRKLGEGFDHPYLSVATVLSIFRNLSPFVQFVGRIMRVIKHNSPTDPANQGIVVFHAGSNIAPRWSDFQDFSQADQEFFQQLLPIEELNFGDASELILEPVSGAASINAVAIKDQEEVFLQEIPLLAQDTEAKKAFEYLKKVGFTAEDYQQAEKLMRLPTTKAKARQASQKALDERVKNAAGKILRERKVNPQGMDLDKKRLGRNNFVVVKSTIDNKVAKLVDRGIGQRPEFTQADLDKVSNAFSEIVSETIREVFNGST